MQEEKCVTCGKKMKKGQEQYEKPVFEEITFDYLELIKETKKNEMPVMCSKCHHCR